MKHLLVLVTLFVYSVTFAQITNLDNHINNELSLKNIPGVSACVVKKGEVVWKGNYGFANLEEQTPVTDQTLFTVASISKLFVGTAILQLYEKGMLDLDEDINSYLNFEVRNPHFANVPITVRQLLKHQSSLRDPESLLFIFQVQGDSPILLGDYVYDYLSENGAYYNTANFNNQLGPGESTWYSNVGFALLGHLVAELSGMPYHTYCRQYIFDPLCMDKSTFFIAELDEGNLASPYTQQSGMNVSLGLYGIPNYPAALLKTNIEELSRFLIAYTNRGSIDGQELFSINSADLLTPYSFSEPNLAWWNGTSWTYTFHFPNDEVWFHGGFMPGIRTRLNYYPSDSTGLIILTNGEGQYSSIEDSLAYYLSEFEYTVPDELPCTLSATTSLKKRLYSQVYPNPAKEEIYIKTNLTGSKTFCLYNLQGILIGKQTNINSTEFRYKPTIQADGIYMYTLENEHGEGVINKLLFAH